MKLRWLIVGIVVAAAGSAFMIKHLVDTRKPALDFVDSSDDKNFSRFSHEMLDTDVDGTDILG
jgi:hypothetical protein